MKDPAPLVHIIVVTFNGLRHLEGCFRSLRETAYPNYRVVLVDNASSDGCSEYTRAHFPEVQVLRLETNLGFAGGNNRAMETAIAKGADYVLLLNDDTVVLDADWLTEAVALCERAPNVGMVGFHLLSTLPSDDEGAKLPPLASPALPTPVDRIDGCALFIRTTLLKRIGLLDEVFFAYAEEDDLEARAQRSGVRLMTIDRRIYHFGGGTSRKFPRQAAYLETRNAIRFSIKNRGLFRTMARVFKLADIVCSPFPFLLDRKNDSHLRARGEWSLLPNLRIFISACLWNLWNLRRTLAARKRDRERERNAATTEKTVLWIDSNFTLADPTTRHLIWALPQLQAAGWKVKIWCFKSEIPRETVEHVVFRSFRALGPLNLLYFTVRANLRGLWLRITGRPRPATIIHATSSTYFGSDIVSVHFLNCVWVRKQIALGFSSLKEFVTFWIHVVGFLFERLHWWSPALRLALPVSDSVGEEVRRRARSGVLVETMPNSYDESRFNPAVRAERRDSCRQNLGLGSEDAVFAFTSLGHHKRKGFWLAIGALVLLRKDPAMSHVKYLVVGGHPGTLSRLQARLGRIAPDWKKWITFTGQQKDVETYLAAADVLLFPSYFEAFSLAEIEAAAMGIPLLLTRHHGSEMILEDGVNGLWLEFDSAAIAETLRRFLKMKPSDFRRSIGRAFTRSEYAERLLSIYERQLADPARGSQAQTRPSEAPPPAREEASS